MGSFLGENSLFFLLSCRRLVQVGACLGLPAPCRQTEIVFLWLGVNQWGEGIRGPAAAAGSPRSLRPTRTPPRSRVHREAGPRFEERPQSRLGLNPAR